ncbi:phosphoribosylformylglycinamidine synthase [Gehongia tenuis]|uniref:Phosphoribosylformylglycinamidine synthase n=1 Tax=Gehongia tenuis TaxID=2763655 RepID=A0A926D505_9FIRM|nr:phosphoribosylformylglycinamidine synthase [Gehongia tenuis]MBC8530475.1 phosphoribosylformylglycinamidine synthase [Gehongia tenuis]
MNQRVRRVYVEKKREHAQQAEEMRYDLKHNLLIRGLTGVRIINRYDVSGIDDETYERAKAGIFAEPQVDVCWDEEFTAPEGSRVFVTALLPGQYDQRADSAAQCIQILTAGDKPAVRYAKVIVLMGELTDAEFAAAKAYTINPVEAEEAGMDKPESLAMETVRPADVKTVEGFTDLDEAGLMALLEKMGFAMDLADLKFCQDYFKEEKRDPTVTEMRMIDTYWSDHCRHTTFLTELTDVDLQEPAAKAAYDEYLAARERVYGKREKPICLMDMAVLAAKDMKKRGLLANLDESEEINACSIVVPVEANGKTEDYLVMFKNETHNHPTEIEPFGGAATCLGGAIRDPLSGRSYVYQAMRITGSGDPRTKVKDTLHGKLPQRKITRGAAQGYSSYGNQIGLATGIVSEVYHPGYVAKRMELGAVIAAAPKKNVVRERPAPGDVIVLLGGRTGRDGCGGATGSSKAHTEKSLATCGAEVQKGNPPEERKLQRLFRNPKVTRMIKRCNDFGAGGVSVAIGELADGLRIDLDRVPKKYEGLDGTELAISESQERMAVVIRPEDMDEFIAEAARENLEATHVATVTEEPRLVMTWRGQTVCDITRAFLNTNGAMKRAVAHVPEADKADLLDSLDLPEGDIKAKWLAALSDLNVCSQKGLTERFDGSIGAGSVLMPFGGRYQLTPAQALAGKIPVLEGETDDATLMAYGYDPMLSAKSPFHGAVYAVVEGVAKVVAAGGHLRDCYLTMQEFFERPGVKPERWGKPLGALLGAFWAQQRWSIAAIGGKDSMSGSFNDLDVPPTLVSIAVAPTKASRVISPEFKKAGNKVYITQITVDENGLPDMSALEETYEAVAKAIASGKVVSAYAVGMGGLAEAVSKMGFGNKLGFTFAGAPELFTAEHGRLVLEAEGELPFELLGEVMEAPVIRGAGFEIGLEEALSAWTGTLEAVFPTRSQGGNGVEKAKGAADATSPKRCTLARIQPIGRPRVLIPVFPGTNCEYDTARAFERAGAEADVLIIRNLTQQAIAESLDQLVEAIQRSQIVMLPGGFSGGDEPEGSAKFIVAAFRNPRVKDAVHELLKNRDGLMLGICNGFQALVKLGLVPYGEIRDPREDSPTLTYNAIGRHVSQMVYTKIVSKASPWLAETEVGDVNAIAVSHGEGRFVATKEDIRWMIENGQVATQYVDGEGRPAAEEPWNPNGSACAIEGIMSPDGRVLGKMGHSERCGRNIFKNIVGEKDQGLFRSGVNYYR